MSNTPNYNKNLNIYFTVRVRILRLGNMAYPPIRWNPLWTLKGEVHPGIVLVLIQYKQKIRVIFSFYVELPLYSKSTGAWYYHQYNTYYTK